MDAEKIRIFLEKLIEKASAEEGIVPLPILCFYDIGCNINRCRSEDYDLKEGIGGCCRYYEDICKQRLEMLTDDIKNNFKFLLEDIEKKVNGF
jgi:hypothetical protein